MLNPDDMPLVSMPDFGENDEPTTSKGINPTCATDGHDLDTLHWGSSQCKRCDMTVLRQRSLKDFMTAYKSKYKAINNS